MNENLGMRFICRGNIQGTPMTMLKNSFMCIEPSLRPQTTPVHPKLNTATGSATPFIGHSN